MRKAEESELNAGATAVVVVVTKDKIVCANAGDSRAALWQKDKCVPLSFDHKPENPVEKKRIEKTGVPIIQGRVNGLNLTRSIGDFSHKKVAGLPFNQQPITCMPDII
jgi:protein phosphatase 2C family protein 2/3